MSAVGTPGNRTLHRQRGAVAVYVAIALIAILTAVFLVIDIGRLYYAQRDLQKLATLAAISGARSVSGCSTTGVPGSLAEVQASVQNVLAVNASVDSAATAAMLAGFNGSPGVELGRTESVAGLRAFRPLDPGNPDERVRIDSLRVNLTRPTPARILPFVTAASGTLKASATAREPALASFRLGTTAVSLNAGGLNQLLTALLGTDVALSLVDYQNGLAASRVNLANLMLAAGVGDLNELLALETDLPGALDIVGQALSATGDAASGIAGGLISGLAGQPYAGATTTTNYFGQIFNDLGEGLNPVVTDTLATVPFVDGLGLLTALGEAASEGKTIPVMLSSSIPGITSLGVFATVLDNARIAGPGPAGFDDAAPPQAFTWAQSSQIVVKIRTSLSVGSIVDARIAIDLQGANGMSELLSVTCPTQSNPLATAEISTTASLLTATVGTFDAGAPLPQPLVPGNVATLAGIPIVTIEVASSGGGESAETQTGSGPDFPLVFPPISNGDNTTTLVEALLSGNLQLVGLPVGTVLSALLVPVTTLLDSTLDPLLDTLGISAGQAQVTLDSIATAQPVIVTTCLPGASPPRGCPALPSL